MARSGRLGIVFHDWLNVPWEQGRGFIAAQFEQLYTTLRAQQAAAFDTNNQLLADAIAGDGTIPSRYVANTGDDNAPTWDRVNLSDGVQGRLPFSNITQLAADKLLGADVAGDVGAIGVSAALTISSGTLALATPVTAQSTPSDPTGTTSTSGVMMGLAGSITPTSSGVVLFQASGSFATDTAAQSVLAQLRYGTGTAPTNGAAATGTAIGGIATVTLATVNMKYPFAVQARVTGLTPATAYWFDLTLAGSNGLATKTLTNLSLTAFEIR